MATKVLKRQMVVAILMKKRSKKRNCSHAKKIGWRTPLPLVSGLTSLSPEEKFTRMLRNYLECEWKARFASSAVVSVPKEKTTDDASAVEEEETIVTSFDTEGIGLLEPNVSVLVRDAIALFYV